ncbi:MAG: GyrI-like domain-containing protein [Candidatus Aminicenantes bacterium]|nr:GyrI-like domain-containing protein [Candidatus Aminicenantes bacterium]
MKQAIFALILISSLAAILPAQEVVMQDAPPFTYAYLECQGSYQQIPGKINEFMGAFFQQGLMPQGSFFAMYLNAPGEVKEEELQWRLGFPVPADAPVAAPLQKGECQAARIAVYMHLGPYDKISESYAKVFAFVESQGCKPAGPSMEKYLNNPMEVKPEELRTEINVPVVKK